VAKTYCTVTESPALAAGPVPVIRSAVSSVVGGLPDGTVTVGAFPAVPAGDRSAVGMVAAGPAVVGVVDADVVGVVDADVVGVVDADVVGVVDADVEAVEALGELHPARTTAAMATAANDQVRRRGIGILSRTVT
jgi:hypothetical protein